jgi:cyclopropane fatty-acyl-phospholipid synthase-like methyltransferase
MGNACSMCAAGGDRPEVDIKTMKLYSDIERVDNELRALGIMDGQSIDPATLAKFDSMHYEGDSAVAAAVSALGATSASKVLDVGSGFGGPARYLANHTGCRVTAIELQDDVHTKACVLTSRCGLDAAVTHLHGNFLDSAMQPAVGGDYDGVVSWLVFLHIPDKRALLAKCHAVLAPGGRLFTDDFYMKAEFTAAEKQSLKTDVYCENLPTKAEYTLAVEGAGFADVQWVDKTTDWTKFVTERLSMFKAAKVRFVGLHGEPMYSKLLHFYCAVHALFVGGHLGGVRLTAKKG